jgi:AcrR family transcriptional regulator
MPANPKALSPAPLRADAERNRRRILAAAAEAFADDGIGAGVDDIARRAGVGIATLYRRFPTKDELVLALLGERMLAFNAMGREALEAADPWEGFAGLLFDAVAARARDRSFDEVLDAGRFREHPEMTGLYDEAYTLISRVVERAQKAGALRDGFSFTDFVLVAQGLGAIATRMRDVDPEYWQRPLAVVLDGLRIGDATSPLPGHAPAREQLRRALGASRRS